MPHPLTLLSATEAINKEDVMNCHRCQGLMVLDRAYDLLDSDVHCDVWRCVTCGNLIDTQIVKNRNPHTIPMNKKKRRVQLPVAA